MNSPLPAYAELHCLSNFSFQRGASHPDELIERAVQLGYSALALTDECSLAGVVRAHAALLACQRRGLREDRPTALQLIIGSEFKVQAAPDSPLPPFTLVVLACNRRGYAHLSEWITLLRRAAIKGTYQLHASQIATHTGPSSGLDDCLFIVVPPRPCDDEALAALARWSVLNLGDRVWMGVELHSAWDDARWLQRLRLVGEQHGLPLVACGDVHFHVRSRKPLQDLMTAIALGRPVHECGLALQPNAERHLRSRLRLSRLYPADLLEASVQIARRCRFKLSELRYDYPQELVPAGQTPTSRLRELTQAGLRRRYPQGTPATVQAQIEKELQLIREHDYEKYFLTVEDLVSFARSQNILCQGRGSAANSAVCYVLGITEVDPAQANLLFERFISKERAEPPDIDVDFEHQRREEVIQYIYRKYGRHRTALTATVISYRTRSAVRDVGKALGIDADCVDSLASGHRHWDAPQELAARLAPWGLLADTPRVQQWLTLTQQIIGMPRHLSQHVGGFIIAADSLAQLVPIENAAMPERTVIQWDKDDLDTLGLLKVDVLALGMLTALHRALDHIAVWRGHPMRLQDIPREDPATYDMICQADTVGVFQIESRAQMSMLPRLKPRRFYDLVVQVAIVRPGPIQGGMVHPFLNTRLHKQNAPYPALLAPALARTHGVPIFQEQVMQIVMLGAGFTPGEADQLRRAMAAWKRKGGLEPFQDRIVTGLTLSTGQRDFAERIFEMIKGFGSYGFPESHAASFAILVYFSAWIKCHEPGAFLAALLNSQPMGFYSPSQLVQDARRHGVTVLPADVAHSDAACTLPDRLTVRLGLQGLHGLGTEAIERIVQARRQAPFSSVQDLADRAGLDQADLRHLASADALHSLAGHRRQQVWEASALHRAPGLLATAPVHEAPLQLPLAPEGEEIVFDYAATGLSLRRHPLALLRERLLAQRLQSAETLRQYPNGRLARACGLVTMRQQPGTAKGTVFVSLEDETGSVNVIVWPQLRDRYRQPLLEARLLAVFGIWQSLHGVQHLVARRLVDLSPWLGRLTPGSRDFH